MIPRVIKLEEWNQDSHQVCVINPCPFHQPMFHWCTTLIPIKYLNWSKKQQLLLFHSSFCLPEILTSTDLMKKLEEKLYKEDHKDLLPCRARTVSLHGVFSTTKVIWSHMIHYCVSFHMIWYTLCINSR